MTGLPIIVRRSCSWGRKPSARTAFGIGDSLLVHSERRLIDLAERLVVLADASKFDAQAGILLCSLDRVDTIITDRAPPRSVAAKLEDVGTQVIVTS